MPTRRACAAVLVGLLACGCAAGGPNEEPTDIRRDVDAVELVLGGDVMFGRWRGEEWTLYQNEEMLRAIGAATDGADVTLVNLETALCDDQKTVVDSGAIRLTAPPGRARTLAEAGIDLVTLANNHALDCGSHSVLTTVRALARAGVGSFGIDDRSAHHQWQSDDAQVIAIGATVHPPRSPADFEGERPRVLLGHDIAPMVERVSALRAQHPDAILVVSMHWGVEGATEPSAWQRESARALVDAGADVIHGHGSHTVQGIEHYGGAAIAYGLGNLHFDMRRGATTRRVVARVGCRAGAQRRCDIRLVELGDADSR
mgnify:CR=1 FL=1